MNPTVKELEEQKRQIEIQLFEIRKAGKRNALKEIRNMIRDYHLTPSDLAKIGVSLIKPN